MREISLIALALACGCGGAGHPPTARATVAPAYLPIGDDYQTDVVLDGSTSDDSVDDPTGTRPLEFAWAIDDPAPRVTAGSLDAAKVTVRLAGSGPTTVVLTVTDGDGDQGRATVRVGVTVPR